MTWRYFTFDEMKCKHCGECHMDDLFMVQLDSAREIAGIPFHINSGYRCPAHDFEVGGSGNHPTGRASDIGFEDSRQAFKILEGLIMADFKRIGISFKGKFIHCDRVENRPTPALWSY